jgi:hypothetical protein
MKTPQKKVVADRWRQAISRRLQYDKILTKKWYSISWNSVSWNSERAPMAVRMNDAQVDWFDDHAEHEMSDAALGVEPEGRGEVVQTTHY